MYFISVVRLVKDVYNRNAETEILINIIRIILNIASCYH